MGTSDLKRLQQIAFIAVAAFMALGFTIVQRGFTEISKKGGATLKAIGPQTKQMRSVQDFDRVQAGEIYDVDVSFGSRPSVTIEAPQDLLPHLTSDVHGGTLNLSSNVNFNLPEKSKIKAHVVTKRLVGATISGAGKMVINGRITEHTFDANASGAATLKLSANVDTFRLEASGAAKTNIDNLGAKTLRIQASGAAICKINGSASDSSIGVSGAAQVDGQLTSNSANIQTSGAAHAALRVVNSLTAEASGASNVSYSGNPGKVVQHTSGVANIRRSN